MSILSKLNKAKAEDWDRAKITASVGDPVYSPIETKTVDKSIFAPLCPPSFDAVRSDGDSTSYYELPNNCSELQDLIEYREMDFATANVFKAAWRDGKKVGTTSLYDWKKIRWFADRKIKQLEEYQDEEDTYESDNGIY